MRCFQFSAVCLLLLFVGVGFFGAAPPDQVSFQGILRNSSGKVLTGDYSIVFRFFDAETAGGEILSDSHLAANGQAIHVEKGMITVLLGSGTMADGQTEYPNDPYTSLAKAFQDFSDIWMQIEVGQPSEILAPRIKIVSSPYALKPQTTKKWVIKDQKPGGTDGDTIYGTYWKQVVLNTMTLDSGGEVRLSANQITLQHGRYSFHASYPGCRSCSFRARLVRVSDGSVVAMGSSTNSGIFGGGISEIDEILDINQPTVFQIEGREAPGGGAGQVASGYDPEIFTIVTVLKLD